MKLGKYRKKQLTYISIFCIINVSGGDQIKRDTKEDYLKQIVKDSRASLKDLKYIKNNFQDSMKSVKLKGSPKNIEDFQSVFKGIVATFSGPNETLMMAKAIASNLKIKVAIIDGDVIAPQLDFYESFNPKFKNHTSHLSDLDATSLNLMIYEYNAKGHITPMIESYGIHLTKHLTLFSGNYNPINCKFYNNAPLTKVMEQLSLHYELLVVTFSKEYLSNPMVKTILELSKFNLFFISPNHSEARYIQNIVTLLKSNITIESLRNIGVASLNKNHDLCVYKGLYEMPILRLTSGKKGYKKLLWSIVWELV